VQLYVDVGTSHRRAGQRKGLRVGLGCHVQQAKRSEGHVGVGVNPGTPAHVDRRVDLDGHVRVYRRDGERSAGVEKSAFVGPNVIDGDELRPAEPSITLDNVDFDAFSHIHFSAVIDVRAGNDRSAIQETAGTRTRLSLQPAGQVVGRHAQVLCKELGAIPNV